MSGSPPELRSFLEAEMFFGVKKRERIAYAVAGGINTGDTLGFLRFEGSVTELFEVAVLPGMQFPDLVEPAAEATNDAFVLSDEALSEVVEPDKSSTD